ncbi:hypothetical protein SLIQ_02095 [Serratia liquefaciens FK01]|nr:hypothetical protein SLIQ_02095 [Serratia liquefaciens FK01]
MTAKKGMNITIAVVAVAIILAAIMVKSMVGEGAAVAAAVTACLNTAICGWCCWLWWRANRATVTN